MLTVVSLEIGLLIATGTTSVLTLALGGVYHGGRHNTSGHSNDGVTKNHDDAREKASNEGDRGDVAIANRSERDNRPIDTGADVCKLCARLSSLNHKHECAQNSDEDEDKKEINKYLTEAEFNALHEEITFVDKREELEHPKNADESENTQDEEIACAGQWWDEGEVERQGGQEVDDAKETEGILLARRRTIETQDVLEGKEACENIFEDGKHILEPAHHYRFCLDECNEETEHNGHHHYDVKSLAHGRVSIEHDVIETWLIFKKSYELFHGCKGKEKIEELKD